MVEEVQNLIPLTCGLIATESDKLFLSRNSLDTYRSKRKLPRTHLDAVGSGLRPAARALSDLWDCGRRVSRHWRAIAAALSIADGQTPVLGHGWAAWAGPVKARGATMIIALSAASVILRPFPQNRTDRRLKSE